MARRVKWNPVFKPLALFTTIPAPTTDIRSQGPVREKWKGTKRNSTSSFGDITKPVGYGDRLIVLCDQIWGLLENAFGSHTAVGFKVQHACALTCKTSRVSSLLLLLLSFMTRPIPMERYGVRALQWANHELCHTRLNEPKVRGPCNQPHHHHHSMRDLVGHRPCIALGRCSFSWGLRAGLALVRG
jgi:hypothetical protein